MSFVNSQAFIIQEFHRHPGGRFAGISIDIRASGFHHSKIYQYANARKTTACRLSCRQYSH
jgi:hypothetical protein